MKKKQKQILVGIIIIALAILIISNFKLPLSLSVMSISNVDVVNDGAKILVYARQGGGQELQIDFTPSALNQFLIDKGFKATKTSTLKAKYLGGTKNIQFTPNENNKINILMVSGSYTYVPPFVSCSVNTCQSKGYASTVTTYVDGTLNTNCNCVEAYQNGYISGFATGFSTNGYSVEFDVDGEKATLTDSSNSITMASGKAKITWQGNLLGTNEISVPNYQVYHLDTSWYLVDPNAYTTVSNAYTQFKQCVMGDQGKSRYNTCSNAYYNIMNTNLNSQNQAYLNQVPNAQSISFSQGLMFVQLKQPTFFPTYTIELDATKVGIVKLVGQPDIITCIPPQTFEEASSKSVSTTIKNIGTSEGSFNFRITCDKQEMSGGSDSVDFATGEQKSINLLLYGGNPTKSTYSSTCNLEVTDANKPENKDSCQFTFDVKYKSGIQECTGTETKCSGDFQYLFTCNAGAYVQTKCDYKCGFLSGKATCVTSGGGQGGGENNTGTCQSCVDWAKNLFRGKDTQCKEGEVIKAKWYNPVSWVIDLSGASRQGIVCPMYLTVMAVLIFIVVVILMLILRIGTGITIVLVRFFKSLKRRFK